MVRDSAKQRSAFRGKHGNDMGVPRTSRLGETACIYNVIEVHVAGGTSSSPTATYSDPLAAIR